MIYIRRRKSESILIILTSRKAKQCCVLLTIENLIQLKKFYLRKYYSFKNELARTNVKKYTGIYREEMGVDMIIFYSTYIL